MAKAKKNQKSSAKATSAQTLGCCGIVCSECGAFKATKTNDVALAEKTAAEWSKQFNVAVKVENVWCDGCTEAGRKCTHCGECEIRACATGRKLAHCGLCADYPCKALTGFFGMVPTAKATLDALRA